MGFDSWQWIGSLNHSYWTKWTKGISNPCEYRIHLNLESVWILNPCESANLLHFKYYDGSLFTVTIIFHFKDMLNKLFSDFKTTPICLNIMLYEISSPQLINLLWNVMATIAATLRRLCRILYVITSAIPFSAVKYCNNYCTTTTITLHCSLIFGIQLILVSKSPLDSGGSTCNQEHERAKEPKRA